MTDGLHPVRRAHQDDIGATTGEETVGNDTHHIVDLRFQCLGIQDFQVLQVEDDIAVVGHEAFTVHRLSAQCRQLTTDVGARHRNHLHRQRESAEQVDLLALIDDADELLGHRRNDLFTGQRAATALDQIQVRIELVGAIDVELHLADRVQVEHLNAMTPQALGGRFGAGHGAGETALDRGQRVDKTVGSGAGAHADNAVAVEAALDMVDGCLCDRLLHLVLCHGCARC